MALDSNRALSTLIHTLYDAREYHEADSEDVESIEVGKEFIEALKADPRLKIIEGQGLSVQLMSGERIEPEVWCDLCHDAHVAAAPCRTVSPPTKH